ncbi:MAG: hypothetical protein ACYCUM_09600 [Solirubrobacteraceae bacterium]
MRHAILLIAVGDVGAPDADEIAIARHLGVASASIDDLRRRLAAQVCEGHLARAHDGGYRLTSRAISRLHR